MVASDPLDVGAGDTQVAELTVVEGGQLAHGVEHAGLTHHPLVQVVWQLLAQQADPAA